MRVTEVFRSGRSCVGYPLRACFSTAPAQADAYPVNILVSVPKRLFKRAVKRNLLKRRMREAYRLNQQTLSDFANEKAIRIDIAFSYIADTEKDYSTIEKAILKIIDKIQNNILENS